MINLPCKIYPLILVILITGLYGGNVFAQNITPIIQTGHADRIMVETFTANAQIIITGGMDERVLFWDVNSQQQIRSISGFTEGVSCLDYHEETNTLVVGTYGKQAFVYDLNKSETQALSIFEFAYYIGSIAISPDGNTIAIGSADYSLTIIRNNVVKTIQCSSDVQALAFNSASNMLFFGTYNGEVFKLDLTGNLSLQETKLITSQTNAISDMALSQSDKYLAFGAEGYEGGVLSVVNLKKNKIVYSNTAYLSTMGAKFNSIQFLNDKELMFMGGDYHLKSVNFKRNNIVQVLDNVFDNHFTVSNDGKWIAASIEDKSYIISSLEPSQMIELKGVVESPLRFHGEYNNELIVEYSSGIKSWNLETLKLEMIKEKFYDYDWDYHSYAPNLSVFADRSSIRDSSGKSLVYFYNKNQSKRIKGAFSPNAKYYTFLDDQGNLVVTNLDERDNRYDSVNNFQKSWRYRQIYAQNKIDRIIFAPHKNEMIVLSDNIEVLDLDSLKFSTIATQIRKGDFDLPAAYNPVQDQFLTGASFEVYDSFAYEGHPDFQTEWRSVRIWHVSGEAQYKNVFSGVTYLWNLANKTADQYLIRDSAVNPRAEVTALLYDSFRQSMICAYTDGSVVVLDASDSNYTYQWKGKATDKGLVDMLLSSDGKFVFALMNDGRIEVLSRKSFKKLCDLIALEDNEFIVMDSSGNYKRSKNTANAVAFNQNGSISKLSQFDKVFNQPHLVLGKLGLVDADRLAIIERLAKNKQKDEDVSLSTLSYPQLEFEHAEKIDYSTSDNVSCLFTKVKSNGSTLDYMKVWVNGVPLYNEYEVPSSKKTAPEWVQRWDIPLKYGLNVIKFTCYSEDGLSSNERIVSVQCAKPYVMPRLYMAVISVSNYQDASKNLQYAVKDGRDLSKVFVNSNGEKRIGFPSRFEKVIIDSFFNDQATRENIINWKKKIAKTRPDDYVLLYVSGHGLLDDSLNFWFATHDIDFDEPSNKGMSFEQLEDLLVGIPAQQKLFLMDACHSGEVIDNDLQLDSNFNVPNGSRGTLIGYKTKGAQVIDLDGVKVNRNNLKQELFSNYNSRSGATVISAAAGNSFALESPEWSNGIFTYTVIGGMIYRWADLNDDGEVSVVELSRYVTSEVKEKTAGMQVPNDRQENIENNFRIW